LDEIKARSALEDSQMLPESDDILWCLGRAKACAEAAATARTEPERTDFLKLERNWLVLALSYSIGAQVRETAMGPRAVVAFDSGERRPG
jgi:hypothetical protein